MLTNETLKIIKQRRSTRSFKDGQIKDQELQAILEAGLYAPSASNQQMWHLTVVKNQDLLNRINLAAKEVAKQAEVEYVRKMANNEKLHIFYNAPTVVFISGRKDTPLVEADCAALAQNMIIAAESLGLGSCWVNYMMFALHSPQGPQFIKELKIPEGYQIYYSVALGYKNVEAANAPARKPDRVTYID